MEMEALLLVQVMLPGKKVDGAEQQLLRAISKGNGLRA